MIHRRCRPAVRRRALLGLALVALAAALAGPVLAQRGGGGERWRARARELYQEVQRAKADGYDVSQAEALLPSFRDAIEAGDRERARAIGLDIRTALDRARGQPVTGRTDGAREAARDRPIATWTPLPRGPVPGEWSAGDVPVGIVDPYHRKSDPKAASRYIRPLGAGWVRLSAPASGGLDWGYVHPDARTWRWDRGDQQMGRAHDDHVHVLVTIGAAPPSGARRPGPPRFPADLASYRDFVQHAAERYRGRVDAWQIGNEPDSRGFWRGTPQEYARLVAETAPILRRADDRVPILLAGVVEPSYAAAIFAELERLAPKRRLVDAGDVHVFGTALGGGAYGPGYRRLQTSIREYHDAARGTSYADLPLWVTETGTWDGQPDPRLPPQTERDQARDLVRRFGFSYGLGARRVFWTSLVEWTTWTGNGRKFNFVGLVRHPSNGRGSGVKLAYPTLQMMIARLHGFTGVEVLPSPDRVTALAFTLPHGRVVLAWYDRLPDGPARATLHLRAHDPHPTVERAVPARAGAAAPSGERSTLTVSDGGVDVVLDDDPVYVYGAD